MNRVLNAKSDADLRWYLACFGVEVVLGFYASSETSDISSAVATGSTLDFSNLAYYPLYLSLDVCILSIENQISLFLLFALTVHTTYDLPPELPYSLLFMVLPCARALSPQGGWKAGRKTIGIGSRSKACCWSVVAYY